MLASGDAGYGHATASPGMAATMPGATVGLGACTSIVSMRASFSATKKNGHAEVGQTRYPRYPGFTKEAPGVIPGASSFWGGQRKKYFDILNIIR